MISAREMNIEPVISTELMTEFEGLVLFPFTYSLSSLLHLISVYVLCCHVAYYAYLPGKLVLNPILGIKQSCIWYQLREIWILSPVS